MTRRATPAAVMALALCAALGPSRAWAQQAKDLVLEESRDYLVGAALTSSADHLGTSDQKLSLRPIWAFQLGRFRFASSGASALLYQGRETVDNGVSTVLARSDRLSLNTSLSIDDGRSWARDPVYQGLPRVRTTLRGRLTAGWTINDRWTANARVSQDLLGREGGLHLDTGLNYRRPVSSQTHWDLSVGLGWANGTYSATHYGIRPADAAATGLPAYAAGAGWDTVSIGWRLTSAISRRWVFYGGVGANRLIGDARHSPLATRPTTYSATVGLAYRNL